MLAGAARQRRVCMRFSRGQWPQCPGTLDSDSVTTSGASLISSPHRLVVRTSRRGRDNPGSNPGADRQLSAHLFCVMLHGHMPRAHCHIGAPVRLGENPRHAGIPPILALAHLATPLHQKSASSSGQDVASRPRQPRFKSWCGQAAQCPLVLCHAAWSHATR